MDINELLTDKQKEEEGVWFTVSSTSRIKLARIGNSKFNDYMAKLLQPYKTHRMANRDIPDSLKIELSIKCIARTVIKDWEGFTENGQPFPFSEENAIRLMKDSREFSDLISSLASESSEYRKTALEEASKN